MKNFLVFAAFRDSDGKTFIKNHIIKTEEFPSSFSLMKFFYNSREEIFLGVTGITEMSEKDLKNWAEEWEPALLPSEEPESDE